MQSLNIVFTGQNQVETRSEAVRELAPHEVLLQSDKTLVSTGTEGICLSRLFESGSSWEDWVKYPFYPGYCNVGHIIALGSEVTGFQLGQRVGTRSNHRQYNVVSAAHLHPIPDGIHDDEATWFGLATIVQNGVRRAEHALGDTVVTIGVGPLGQLVTQHLRLLGAKEVIVIDPAPKRIAMACAHGATVGLNTTVEMAKQQVLDATGGAGADVVYDVTGNAAVLIHALPLVRRFGKMMILGDTGSPSQQRLTKDIINRGVRIIGAHDNNPPPIASDHTPWSHRQMIQLFFIYMGRGEMRTADLITHRFDPREAPDAYRLMREDRPNTLGVVFDWTQLEK